MGESPDLFGIYLFVRDLEATIAFYELLGLEVEPVSPVFARSTLPNGTTIGFGCEALTRSYDPNWQEPTGPAGNTINFVLSSHESVDAIYERLVGAGHHGHLPPCDPPWEARFAIVDDPDGNQVGLHGPRDLESDRRRERA